MRNGAFWNDSESHTQYLLHPHGHCLEGCRKSSGWRRWGPCELDPRKHTHAQPGVWTQCSVPWSSPKTQDNGVSTAGFNTRGLWRKQTNTERQKSCLGNLFLRCVLRDIQGITEDRILHELLATCVYLSTVFF